MNAFLEFIIVTLFYTFRALIAFGLAYGFRWVTGLDISNAVVNFGGFIMAICLNLGIEIKDKVEV